MDLPLLLWEYVFCFRLQAVEQTRQQASDRRQQIQQGSQRAQQPLIQLLRDFTDYREQHR
mgnify:FL=1